MCHFSKIVKSAKSLHAAVKSFGYMMTSVLKYESGEGGGCIPISVLRLWLPSGWNWGARYQLSSLRLIYRNFELIFSTERFIFAKQVP